MTPTVDPLCPPERRPAAAAPLDSCRSIPFALSEVPRELGRIVGRQPGPTLVCLGGLHGNEPAGVLAIQRVLESLGQAAALLQGEFVGLAGNRSALAVGRRFVDHDLNRAWRPDRLARLMQSPGGSQAEDREQLELDAVLQEILDEAPGRLYLLDIHTTSGPGSPFAILDDTLANRELALDFPVPLVLGLEEELAGTLASYLTARGVTVLGFEAGQHYDPGSVERAEAAIWLALDSCDLLAEARRLPVERSRRLLARDGRSSIRTVEVRHRHAFDPAAGFTMLPGFENFQAVAEGQILAHSGSLPVAAPFSGLLLMPLYQDQGEDGFFLVREVRPMWLQISAALRGRRLERFLHWLPGVTRDRDRPDTYIVDRRYARWFAPQLFHLLGFRRQGRAGRKLVMTRRRDRSS